MHTVCTSDGKGKNWNDGRQHAEGLTVLSRLPSLTSTKKFQNDANDICERRRLGNECASAGATTHDENRPGQSWLQQAPAHSAHHASRLAHRQVAEHCLNHSSGATPNLNHLRWPCAAAAASVEEGTREVAVKP
jgi:hypothetical protein